MTRPRSIPPVEDIARQVERALDSVRYGSVTRWTVVAPGGVKITVEKENADGRKTLET